MDCGQSEWHFFEGELDRPDVRALLDRHFAEMRADSPPEACHVLPIDGLRAANIRFLSLRDPDGRLLGIISIGDLVKDIIAEQRFTIEQLEHYISGERG